MNTHLIDISEFKGFQEIIGQKPVKDDKEF
jgi:hypothetical protein